MTALECPASRCWVPAETCWRMVPAGADLAEHCCVAGPGLLAPALLRAGWMSAHRDLDWRRGLLAQSPRETVHDRRLLLGQAHCSRLRSSLRHHCRPAQRHRPPISRDADGCEDATPRNLRREGISEHASSEPFVPFLPVNEGRTPKPCNSNEGRPKDA